MVNKENSYTVGNKDDIPAAIQLLNSFTKNWCMNCEKTEAQSEPVFRCNECPFLEQKTNNGICLIKRFAYDHDKKISDFGCMTR